MKSNNRNKSLTLLLTLFCVYSSCVVYNRKPDEVVKMPDILKSVLDSLLVLPDSSDNVELLIFKKTDGQYTSRKFVLYSSGELEIGLPGLDPNTYPFRFLKRSEIDRIVKKLNDRGYFGLTRSLLFNKFFIRKFGCILPDGSCCFNPSDPKIIFSTFDSYVPEYQCTFQFVNFKHEMHYSSSEFSGLDDIREIIILDSCMTYLENILLKESSQ